MSKSKYYVAGKTEHIIGVHYTGEVEKWLRHDRDYDHDDDHRYYYLKLNTIPSYDKKK